VSEDHHNRAFSVLRAAQVVIEDEGMSSEGIVTVTGSGWPI
jgi:hypothetical protein